MLERIPDVPDGIDAFRAVGKVTADDYELTVEPLLDEARRQDRRLRLLLQVGPEYEGFTAGAVRGKTETWRHHPTLLRMIDGYALVSDVRWLREWIQVAGFLLPFPMRVFGNDERDDALAWLGSLPEGPGVTHRLLPEQGVLVVEVTEPLRVQDFDALATTADSWLATHDTLPGVVLHARGFPGWENVGSLLRHVRFVRDHHRAVRRVAVAVDGPLADLMPRLADHFVRAELRRFRYDELEDAVGWAAGPGDQQAAVVGEQSVPSTA
jgi:hypothetical protein